MKNINLLEQILKLITANFALILSTMVNVLLVMSNIRSAQIHSRATTYQQYLNLRYDAYQKLLKAIAHYNISPENDDAYRNLLASAHSAMMISHEVYAEAFSDFCCILEEIAPIYQRGNQPSKDLLNEFVCSRKTLEVALREEMLDSDPTRHKLANKIICKRKRKAIIKSILPVCKKTKSQ